MASYRKALVSQNQTAVACREKVHLYKMAAGMLVKHQAQVGWGQVSSAQEE